MAEKFRNTGSDEAVLLNADREEVERIDPEEFGEALRERNGEVESVVVGSEIDQRSLDAASEGGVETVVGAELGPVVKKPLDINVVTETELP